MQDRVPGAPGQYKASVTAEEFQKLQTGESFTITLTRDDQPIAEGTPYNKASVLPDEVAAIICPDIEDPTIADAFAALGYANALHVAIASLKKLAYSQTDANGAITKALISSYPTSPGVYRVGDGSALGIPDSCGTLVIFDGGGYIIHLFVNGSGIWFAKTDDTYTVTTWKRMPWSPSFALGTEYLTPENWNNCAVYKKWLNLGKLGAAGSTISVAHGITRTWIIGIRGIAVKQGGTAMEMVNGCGNGSVFVQDDKLQWHCILDLSSYNGYVEITYTKA